MADTHCFFARLVEKRVQVLKELTELKEGDLMGEIVRQRDDLAEMRGYVPHLVVAAAEGRDWKIVRFRIRTELTRPDEVAMEPALLKEYLELDHTVELAYAKGGSLTVLRIARTPQEKGMGYFFKKNLGIEVMSGQKNVKRASQLLRGTLMYGSWAKEDIEIRLVGCPENEAVHDGGFILSRKLYEEMLVNLHMDRSDFGIPDTLVEKCEESLAFNCRVWLPGKEGGLLKGQAFVSDCYGDARVLVTHRCNIKKEIQIMEDQDIRVCLEPQPGHDESWTNIQYLINQPNAYHQDDVLSWTKEYLERLEKQLTGGRWIEQARELWEQIEKGKRGDSNGLEEYGRTTALRRRAAEWVGDGNDLRQWPELLVKAAQAATYSVADANKWTIRVPVKDCLHWQVISYTMARLIEPRAPKVTEGCVRFASRYKLAYISDLDYVDSLVNHGGPDQDDFYDLCLYKNKRGESKVLVQRLPNDLGEYSTYWVEGKLPEAIQEAGLRTLKESAPWPMKKNDEKYDHGEDLLAGLAKKEYAAGKAYCLEEVLEQLDMPSSNPGAFVLAKEAWNMTIRADKGVGLAMEKAVDIVQGGTKEEIEAVNGLALKLLQDVVASGVPVPRHFWEKKALQFRLGKGAAYPRKDWKHPVDETVLKVAKLRDDFLRRIEMFSLTCKVPLGKTLKVLNQEILKDAQEFLNQFYSKEWIETCKTPGGKHFFVIKEENVDTFKMKKSINFQALNKLQRGALKLLLDKYNTPELRMELVPHLLLAIKQRPHKKESLRHEPLLLNGNKKEGVEEVWQLLRQWMKV